MNTYTNLDADQGIYFNDQLRVIKNANMEIIRGELEAFKLLPTDVNLSNAVETIVFRTYDAVGMAKLIANYAKDLPRVDLNAKENFAKVKSVGASYGYSVQEIRAANAQGFNLDGKKGQVAAEKHRELWNSVAFYGDKEFNLPGLLNNPNIPVESASADGSGGVTSWEQKTPKQIVADLNRLVNNMVKATRGVEKPDTLLLSHDAHSHITSTNMGNGSDTTIEQYFLKNNKYIKNIESLFALSADDLASNGVTDFEGDIAIIYKKDPSKLELVMPQLYEEFPPQMDGLDYEINTHSRIAGVLVYKPLSLRILEGIW